MTAKTLLTVEEFAAMPEGDGPRFELVDGELVLISSATARHNWVRDELRTLLREYLRAGSVEVWMIDPVNEEIVVRGANSIRALHVGDRLETTLLPGFSVPVSDAIRIPE